MLKEGDRVKVKSPVRTSNSDLGKIGIIREICMKTAVIRTDSQKRVYHPIVARVFFDGGRKIRGEEVCSNVLVSDLECVNE